MKVGYVVRFPAQRRLNPGGGGGLSLWSPGSATSPDALKLPGLFSAQV